MAGAVAGGEDHVDAEPGGSWPTLFESIRGLIDAYPEETVVYPGHMGTTTLGAERATNPFLVELAR